MNNWPHELGPVPERLIAATFRVGSECPRDLGGSMHIADYTHRESDSFVLDEHHHPVKRVVCLSVGAPREVKEMYPYLTQAQIDLWNEYHAYTNDQKEQKKNA